MKHSLIGRERHLRGQPHQCDLVSALDHAAASGHRSRAGDFRLWRSFANAIGEHKSHRLFDSQLAAGNAAIFQSLRDALVGALIFLPHANVGLFAVGRVGESVRALVLLQKPGTHRTPRLSRAGPARTSARHPTSECR